MRLLAMLLLSILAGRVQSMLLQALPAPPPTSDFTFQTCEDDPDLKWYNQRGEIKGGCDHVAKKPKKRCRQSASDVTDGSFSGTIKQVCPIVCEVRACTCTDRQTEFTVKDGSKKVKVNCDDFVFNLEVEDSFAGLEYFYETCSIRKIRTNCPIKCSACGGVVAETWELGLILTYVFISITGADASLSEPNGPFTIFSPSDWAWDVFTWDFDMETFACIVEDNGGFLLAALLSYHIAAGEYLLDASSDGEVIETILPDGNLTVGFVEESGIFTEIIEGDLNSANVTSRNNLATNGVIHIIDNVLIFPGFREAVDVLCSNSTVLGISEWSMDFFIAMIPIKYYFSSLWFFG